MNVYGTVRSHDVANQYQAATQQIQIPRCSSNPYISKCKFFDQRRRLCGRRLRPRKLNRNIEVSPSVEGWINIDELDSAHGFYLRAQVAIRECAECFLIVSPDKAIRPRCIFDVFE